MSKETGEFLVHAPHIKVVSSSQMKGLNDFVVNILNEMNWSTSATKLFLIDQEKKNFLNQLAEAKRKAQKALTTGIRPAGQSSPMTRKIRFPDKKRDLANDELSTIYDHIDTSRDNLIRTDSARLHVGMMQYDYDDFVAEVDQAIKMINEARDHTRAIKFVKAGPRGDREERRRDTLYSEETVDQSAPLESDSGDLD